MRSLSALLTSLLMLLLCATARADEDVHTGPWVGGFFITGGLGSHGASLGTHITARYRSAQVGALGYFASKPHRAALATFGVVLEFDAIELSFEGIGGAHGVDSRQSSLFGGCETDGPTKTLPFAGAMFTIGSRVRTTGGQWGFSLYAGRDLRTARVQTTSTCEVTTINIFGDSSGTDTSTRMSTTESTETLGGSAVGAMFRLGFGIF